MTFKDVPPGTRFRVQGDLLDSIFVRRWKIGADECGYNAHVVAGLMVGHALWIEDRIKVTPVRKGDE